jgi:hypothetical protein
MKNVFLEAMGENPFPIKTIVAYQKLTMINF